MEGAFYRQLAAAQSSAFGGKVESLTTQSFFGKDTAGQILPMKPLEYTRDGFCTKGEKWTMEDCSERDSASKEIDSLKCISKHDHEVAVKNLKGGKKE